MLCLVDLLRTGAVFQFREICSGIVGCAFGLFILRAEFLIFKANQHLSLLDLVAFFDADPSYSPSNLGIYVYLVMRHNVAAGGENHTADIGGILRLGADYVDLRNV